MRCENCHNDFEGNFCNNCGQSSDTHKINLHFIWHDIQHGLFHFDQGILFSIKELFTRPGHSIREYIEGKRVKHFKPLSLLVVLATFYGLLYHSFEINFYTDSDNQLNAFFNDWTSHHFSWLTLALTPIYTIGTYICFKYQGYNFMELFVLNCFKGSQRIAFHLLTFPLIYYVNGSSDLQKMLSIQYFLDLLLIYWTNFQFFDRLSTRKVFFLSLLSQIIFLFLTFIIMVVIWLLTTTDKV